jgi:hypothetical protein
MHRKTAPFIAAAALLTVAVFTAGCGGSTRDSAGTPAVPNSFSQAHFRPGNFSRRTGTLNQWLPLSPGTQWVREGATDVGHRRVPHRVVSTVTGVHKDIVGVTTIVVLDQGIDSGQLAHESVDYFAQDRQGNIWNVGSYAESYEARRFVSVRDAWLAGVKGARAGILIPRDARVGTPPWYVSQPQGADPDVAQVVQTGVRHCVRLRCFNGVRVVREGKASAPDNEFKYYAPGVGQIDNVPKSASKHHDTEQLVNLTRVSTRGLAEVNAEALKLDRHARTTSAGIFGRSAAARATLAPAPVR